MPRCVRQSSRELRSIALKIGRAEKCIEVIFDVKSSVALICDFQVFDIRDVGFGDLNAVCSRPDCWSEPDEIPTLPQMHPLGRSSNRVIATMIGRTERKREEKSGKMPANQATAALSASQDQNAAQRS